MGQSDRRDSGTPGNLERVQPSRPERGRAKPRGWRASAVLLAAAAAAAATLAVSSEDTSPSQAAATKGAHAVATRHSAAPRGRIYWGAWIGPQFTGTEAPWDMQAVTDFQTLAGKGLSLIHFSSPWADCRSGPCVPYKFPASPFDAIRAYGAIPFFSWGSSALPYSRTKLRFSLSSIIRGAHDGYINEWAQEAKAWGHPFFLRFDWEMNGRWFPWSQNQNGGRPDLVVRAWRHVHDIFKAVGARNVTWVWCPNADPHGNFAPLAPLYPGNAYVDWTCVDTYNFDKPWESFDQLVGPTYSLLARIAPGKPMVIGELASTEVGGSKAAWITALLTRDLPYRYPLVRGIVWFEKRSVKHMWEVESSKASQRAFVAGIRRPIYVPNVVGSLKDGRVTPPR